MLKSTHKLFDLIFHYSNFLGSGSGPEGTSGKSHSSQAIEDNSDVSSKGSSDTAARHAATASSSSMMEETTNENDLQVTLWPFLVIFGHKL